MKIEIQRVSDNPANTMLDVYTDNQRPVCKIWEEDFAEILTEKQLKMMEAGQYKFSVSKEQLFTKSKNWYGQNV